MWREEKTLKEKNFAVFSYISKKINVSEDEDITQQINNFNSKLNHKWKCCKGTLKQFVKKEFGWLNTNIDFNVKPEIDDTAAGSSGISSGRPHKNFDLVSLSAKKRRILPLLQEYSTEEILLAAQVSLRHTGQRDAANMLHEVAETSPKRATKIKKKVE